MIIPIESHHPLKRKVWLVYALIAANTAIFLGGILFQAHNALIARFGFIPGSPLPDAFFTCMFLHADLWHLAGNMLFLWIFGDNLEDHLGTWFFAGAYLLTGSAATFSHWVFNLDSPIPLVGASGAISGLMGAYAVMFPRARFKVYLSLGALLGFLRLARARFAVIPLGEWQALTTIPVWAGIQVLGVLIYSGRTAGVAYLAHLGGALAGATLAFALIHGGWARMDHEAGATKKKKK